MPPLRPWVTIALFALWTLPLIPLQMVAVRFGWRLAERLPVFYHGVVCRILRVQVETRGRIAAQRPVLFVCNHISWIDITVLAKLLPASFVAKHEVAGWPFFGLLARLQRSVFIERRARRTADHRDEMTVRLERGDNLILFPEGTSSDGIHVLPFKSAFFSLAERQVNGRPLTVQPVSIAFARLNNLPVGRRTMPVYAWVGDEDLAPHLWNFLKAGPSTVVVELHPPVTIDQFASRKELALHCRAVIRQGVDRVLTGRPAPTAEAPPPLAAPGAAVLPAGAP
ncbi:MAG TPA: lysophospholipid acyltransferase family protein [Candidatus Sulfotelmatobacter sp.]|nr:lysophospholipid acyltransferase family protein [Candidatus Sulfotelmatobacter sp.]